ncbi:hypothetical protein OMAG_000846 [Candidatus Omnitrophus magneticus]|uniref:Uncharacterized protein n=1 Tax=Candidatus Omnitrophus magneticus TaxID=1609969 RepID=A0A0F0CUR9_9BACT|nr:hypothetical protein OMAG_000846 [Candidatus Omnitrophus magneticus]
MLSCPICNTRTVLSIDALVTSISPVSFIIVWESITIFVCPFNVKTFILLSSPICHTRTVLSFDALVTNISPVSSFIIVWT